MTTKAKAPVSINLGNLDVYFAIDISGSMEERIGPLAKGVAPKSPEDTRMTRYNYCQETIIPFANTLAGHDDDGVTFCFFNRKHRIQDNVTNLNIDAEFKKQVPGGGTNLLDPLRDLLALAVKRRGEKQQYIAVMTDGEPDPGTHDAIARLLADTATKVGENGKVCVHFLQVGDDAAATVFLERLNNDLGRLGAPIDMVAVSKIDDIAGKEIQFVVDGAFNN